MGFIELKSVLLLLRIVGKKSHTNTDTENIFRRTYEFFVKGSYRMKRLTQ